MSNVNIKRAVENIKKADTTVYTPVVEVLVNAIQAIEQKRKLENPPTTEGRVSVHVQRAAQQAIDDGLSEIIGFNIEDNGIGFVQENRDSFDTLYSDQKIAEGGKGFGLFTCLRYFKEVDITSVFQRQDGFSNRTFSMGKHHDIIVNEHVEPTTQQQSGTQVRLVELKEDKLIDKKIETVARNLVEKLLPYFITEDYDCPRVFISEADGSDEICLNDFFSNSLSGSIRELSVADRNFSLESTSGARSFLVRVFKFYYPKNQQSKISLVADKREVTGVAIRSYVPEFSEDFYDREGADEAGPARNYIVKAYVFSQYLDENVLLERGGFRFKQDGDVLLGISSTQIEKSASAIAKEAVGEHVTLRQEKKAERVQAYVDQQAPWHKSILRTVNLQSVPYNPTNEQIETHLQRVKYEQEVQIKRDVDQLLKGAKDSTLMQSVSDIVQRISETSRNDLTHYIALRKTILDLFERSLQTDSDGKYSSEAAVHSIIFPQRKDSDQIAFDEHNLWMIDERLNFTEFISSDKQVNLADRPDLLIFNKRIVFRGENTPSNPITIFEFKKPSRDDFVNPSSDEDPVQQIVRYVNSLRNGDYKDQKGRKLLVAQNTPFYGYVICDLSTKVETWLEFEKDFKPMPDRLGWFAWYININLYIEVLSWDKVLADAKMRNKVFFHKLGIE